MFKRMAASFLRFPFLFQKLLDRRWARPRSANSSILYGGSSSRKSGKSGRGKNKDGDVLYKVAVTTGDVKNAGTDAKVCFTLYLIFFLLIWMKICHANNKKRRACRSFVCKIDEAQCILVNLLSLNT